jgi:hypothetical protein
MPLNWRNCRGWLPYGRRGANGSLPLLWLQYQYFYHKDTKKVEKNRHG